MVDFFEQNGFRLGKKGSSIVCVGFPKIQIGWSFFLITLGVPVLIFFGIRIYDVSLGISLQSVAYLLISSCLTIAWLYFLIKNFNPKEKLCFKLDSSGAFVQGKGLIFKDDILSVGVKTKKLAGIQSTVFVDDLYQKTIFIETKNGMEVNLIDFETHIKGVDIPIKEFCDLLKKWLQS